MLRLILSLILASLAGIHEAPAQDLHIYYNAFKDSVHFTRQGKPIERPVVRKGDNVVLHVSNYNNYLYDIHVKKTGGASASTQRSAAGIINQFTGGSFNPLKLFLGAGNPLTGVSSLLKSLTGVFSGGDKDPVFGFAAPAAQKIQDMDQLQLKRMAELKQHASAFETALRKMEMSAQEIAQVQQEMEEVLEFAQVQLFAVAELERIRLNPQIEPTQIKQLSMGYMKSIFKHDDPMQLGLEDIIETANTGAKLTQIKQRYAALILQYAEDVAATKAAGTPFADTKYDFTGSNILQLRSAAANAVKIASENLDTYRSNLPAIDTELPHSKGLDAQQLAKIQTDYLVLMENDFSKTFRHTAEMDDMSLQIIFSTTDSAAAKRFMEKTIDPIKITVYGGLQIKPALGLGFGRFFNQPQNYFVRDSLIHSSNKDAVIPYLITSIQFHPKSRRETSLGGSVGVGIPLVGGSGEGFLDAVTFFLGPSLALGRNQDIVLNGSLMGGKVNRLANGFDAGDRFDGPTELLKTEPVYRLGYSIGVSFNLGSF